jgi:hypothetical protein
MLGDVLYNLNMETPFGRPTLYSEDILIKAKEYLASCEDVEIERELGQRTEYRLNVKLPTIQGLAVYLGVSRDSIYEWAKIHPDFSDTIEQIIAEQADKLINQGLAGNYNPTIAKLMLSSNHGMKEKTEQDITSGGEKLTFGWNAHNNPLHTENVG